MSKRIRAERFGDVWTVIATADYVPIDRCVITAPVFAPGLFSYPAAFAAVASAASPTTFNSPRARRRASVSVRGRLHMGGRSATFICARRAVPSSRAGSQPWHRVQAPPGSRAAPSGCRDQAARQSLDALLGRLETQQQAARAAPVTAPSREEKIQGQLEAMLLPSELFPRRLARSWHLDHGDLARRPQPGSPDLQAHKLSSDHAAPELAAPLWRDTPPIRPLVDYYWHRWATLP